MSEKNPTSKTHEAHDVPLMRPEGRPQVGGPSVSWGETTRWRTSCLLAELLSPGSGPGGPTAPGAGWTGTAPGSPGTPGSSGSGCRGCEGSRSGLEQRRWSGARWRPDGVSAKARMEEATMSGTWTLLLLLAASAWRLLVKWSLNLKVLFLMKWR